MVQPLRLKPAAVEYRGYVPSFFKPLLRAAREGDDLAPTIDQTTKKLGFGAFTCTVSTSARPNCEYYYAARVGCSLRPALIHRG